MQKNEDKYDLLDIDLKEIIFFLGKKIPENGSMVICRSLIYDNSVVITGCDTDCIHSIHYDFVRNKIRDMSHQTLKRIMELDQSEFLKQLEKDVAYNENCQFVTLSSFFIIVFALSSHASMSISVLDENLSKYLLNLKMSCLSGVRNMYLLLGPNCIVDYDHDIENIFECSKDCSTKEWYDYVVKL